MDRLENPNSSNQNSDEDDNIPIAVPVSLSRNCELDEEDIELKKKSKFSLPVAEPITSIMEDEDEEFESMKKERREIPMAVPIGSIQNYNYNSNYEDMGSDEQEDDIVLRKKLKENNIPMAVPIFSNGNANVQQNYAKQESNKREEFEMRKKLKFKFPSVNPNLNYDIQESDEQEEDIEFKKKLKFKIPMAVPISKPNCNVSTGNHNFNSNSEIPTAVPIVSNQNSKTNQRDYKESHEDAVKFQFSNPFQSAMPVRNLNLNYRNEDVQQMYKNPNLSQSFAYGRPLRTSSPNIDPNHNFSSDPMKRKRVQKKERKGRNLMSEVAEELCRFGEGYMRMEKMKMEMVRMMEKERMEMEMKKMKMIVDSHKMIMACIDGFERENRADSS